MYASQKQLADMHIDSLLIKRVEKSWLIVINTNIKKKKKKWTQEELLLFAQLVNENKDLINVKSPKPKVIPF